MVKPSINDVLEKISNRYYLVGTVAKRAREIVDGSELYVENLCTHFPITSNIPCFPGKGWLAVVTLGFTQCHPSYVISLKSFFCVVKANNVFCFFPTSSFIRFKSSNIFPTIYFSKKY